MDGKTCCVTGHRDIPAEQLDYVKDALRREIKKAISDGFTCFLSCFADGVDQYFAEIVVDLQKVNPALQLTAVLPYQKRLDSLRAREQTRVLLDTQHYKEDFDLDKELIQKNGGVRKPGGSAFALDVPPCGTHCLREREIYLKDSYENKVWLFYHDQAKDPILAYALNLDGIQDGKVVGTIYPLDYPSHVERVKLLTCPIERVTVTFEDCAVFGFPYHSRRRHMNELMPVHGNPKTMFYAPESERELAVILGRERSKRSHHALPGNMQEYIETLRKGTVRGQLQESKISASTPIKKAPHKGVQER